MCVCNLPVVCSYSNEAHHQGVVTVLDQETTKYVLNNVNNFNNRMRVDPKHIILTISYFCRNIKNKKNQTEPHSPSRVSASTKSTFFTLALDKSSDSLSTRILEKKKKKFNTHLQRADHGMNIVYSTYEANEEIQLAYQGDHPATCQPED